MCIVIACCGGVMVHCAEPFAFATKNLVAACMYSIGLNLAYWVLRLPRNMPTISGTSDTVAQVRSWSAQAPFERNSNVNTCSLQWSVPRIHNDVLVSVIHELPTERDVQALDTFECALSLHTLTHYMYVCMYACMYVCMYWSTPLWFWARRKDWRCIQQWSYSRLPGNPLPESFEVV